MAKVVSYRQKLIELAKIYKIDRIFDKNLKLTTYDIEIILLKNNVPIPSRRGYISHKLINEVFNPFYDKLKKSFTINFDAGKFFKNFYEGYRKKLIININTNKYQKKFSNSINNYFRSINLYIKNYFKFIISNIVNFFKTLSKIIIESLNDIYNFRYEEKVIRNIFSRSTTFQYEGGVASIVSDAVSRTLPSL